MIVPVIIAGGYGERLWPLSTREVPKPFALRDARGRSLFQATILRVVGRNGFAAPVVVCNTAHHLLVSEQLHALGVDATIILEPEARNTAPAIALAALHCDKVLPEACMLVMPADHQIDEPQYLLAALKWAESAAQNDYIVTFAVEPTSPETGYGYIQRGALMKGHEKLYAIGRFIEKPEREVAERLVQSGEYGWNSGLFLMKPRMTLEQYTQLAPEMLSACSDAYAASKWDDASVKIDAHAFSRVRSAAFDRVIMERTKRGAVVNVAMGWRDLGSWDALHDVAMKDAQANAVTGDVVLKDVTGCHIYTDGTPIHAVGLEDMLVVAAHGKLLVAPRARVNEVVPRYAAQMREDVIQRPWGCFQVVETGAHYQVKQLTVRPKGKISLQRHAKRSEHWVVVRGVAQVTRGQEQFILYENQSTFIPAGEIHRLENPVDEPLIIIEVQTGSYLGEDDIERFEDASLQIEQA